METLHETGQLYGDYIRSAKFYLCYKNSMITSQAYIQFKNLLSMLMSSLESQTPVQQFFVQYQKMVNQPSP